MRRSARSLGACTIAAVLACGGGSHHDGQADGGSDSGSSGGTGAESGDTEPGSCAPTPLRVGLQRLTRAEYNRTVADLFGVTSAPADAFPPDSATSGFDNNAKSLTVSPQLASLLLDAAESVAAEAMANQGGTIIACDPAVTTTCARDTLAALALRVYRRPPSDAEMGDLLDLVADSTAEGDAFPGAIEHALAGMLMSPQFLYKSVPPDGVVPEGGTIVALDDFALATRLSYFLWGSTPDDDLLARASEGTLRDRETLRAEFDRMLLDPKTAALYEGFATQWLQLGKLAAATPDPATFPEFDEDLRAEMLEETRLFFEKLRERDGSALELVTSNETWANASLAGIYGVQGPSGEWFEPIETDATRRAGVLTMPAILTMTSGPTAPNIVKRGVWLAESILCAAPPPPAAGVPPEPMPMPGETERERLARHRLDPSCASCHDLIDPLGFGLESYDGLGRWRDEADGAPVDNLGTLPDGSTYAGAVEMAGLLATGDSFPRCVTTKLMTYSLGRAMEGGDVCVVDAIAAEHVTVDGSFSELLWSVVTSDQFLMEEAP